MKVVAGGFRFSPFPSFSFAKQQVAGIGCDRVLVFGFSGVMISIKSIDVHIGHESSVGVCCAKRSRIYRIGNRHLASFSHVSRKEPIRKTNTENKMSKLSMYMSKSKK